MFLILVAFFGTAIVGWMLNYYVIPERIRTRGYFYGVIILGCVYEFLMFHIPFRALGIELLWFAMGAVVEALAMSGLDSHQKGPGGYGGGVRAAAILLLPFVVFTIVGRVGRAEKMAQELDGVVYQKYHGDHNVPSIVVAQERGMSASLEGIDQAAWDSMVEGKSRISKPAWSAFGEVDGKPVRILPKMKVMFLGPFPD